MVDTTGARTPAERRFLARLLPQVPGLLDWYHVDDEGRPWLMVSLDFVDDGCIRATLRLDFDGSRIHGGWSPAFLNWDDGVRALDAGIDLTPPAGIQVDSEDPVFLADRAVAWFRWHVAHRDGGMTESP